MNVDDAGPAWNAWARVTPVVVGTPSRAPYVRVPLTSAISPGSDGAYNDVRVVDAHGNELPYALDPDRIRRGERSVPLIDDGFIPRAGTQAVLDLGTSGALVDAVRLDVDVQAKPTYFARVRAEASEDHRTWRIAGPDAIIYRVAQDNGRGNQTVGVSPTRSRWLRVLIADPSGHFPLTGAHAGASRGEGATSDVLRTVGMRQAVSTVPGTHDQRSTLSSAEPVRPAAVFVSAPGAQYDRSVGAETSEDGTTWTPAGEGTISRFARGVPHDIVPLEERTVRFVRVTVRNGNDAPLPNLLIAVRMRPHAIVFAAGSPPYRVLSGNPGAPAPSYDLAARLQHDDWRATAARLGATAGNVGFHDTRPLGERFPWLLTAALITLAGVLGVLALRVVRPAGAT